MLIAPSSYHSWLKTPNNADSLDTWNPELSCGTGCLCNRILVLLMWPIAWNFQQFGEPHLPLTPWPLFPEEFLPPLYPALHQRKPVDSPANIIASVSNTLTENSGDQRNLWGNSQGWAFQGVERSLFLNWPYWQHLLCLLLLPWWSICSCLWAAVRGDHLDPTTDLDSGFIIGSFHWSINSTYWTQ